MDTDSNNTNSGQTNTKSVNPNISFEEISPGIFRASSKNSKYIIEYDMSKCIGAASCAIAAANTFFMNQENLAEIRTDIIDFDKDDAILEAAQSCPVFAITIIDKESEEIIYPVE